jgi:hypothetical protein
MKAASTARLGVPRRTKRSVTPACRGRWFCWLIGASQKPWILGLKNTRLAMTGMIPQGRDTHMEQDRGTFKVNLALQEIDRRGLSRNVGWRFGPRTDFKVCGFPMPEN